jgi:hypothetical protein
MKGPSRILKFLMRGSAHSQAPSRSTMASNANPLHPPLEAEQYSEYTSIGCALVVPPGTFLIPHRRWLPQPAYTPPSKWKVSTGSPNKQLPSISFDYVDRPNQGVPMRELSARNLPTLVRMLQGANEPVFSQTGLRKITLRIHVSIVVSF